MDVYTWVIFLYVAGTLMVGWFLLHEVNPTGHKSKDRQVGASYWGVYNGSAFESERSITLHEIKDEELAVICGRPAK